MKVLKSSSITPFGGLNFVINELDKHEIGKLLFQDLPALSPQCKYTWRDIFYSYWSVFYCGGDCAEDLGGNFRDALNNTPKLAIPSPDRVLGRLIELAIDPILFTSNRSKKLHHFVVNDVLNELNLKICKKLFNNDLQNATVDYDNTICYTEKKDATRTYKFENGYQLGVAFIGSQIVYVENRNGNSTAHVGQLDTLTQMFLQLQKQEISVKRFRADSATYGLEMINVINQFADHFYLRARMNQTLEKAISSITEWQRLPNQEEEIYRGETIFEPFKATAKKIFKHIKTRPYRLVIIKEKRRDGQVNFFTGEACLYSAVITNDQEMIANEIVHFYNQRGAAEKEFDVLKNDFGWNKLPFSFLNQNNVYLLTTAMCRNIYSYLIQTFSKKVSGLKPTYRIKKFIFRFICIPAKWIKHAGQWHLRLYGNIAFKT
jgi:hypothetical protein